MQEEYEHHCVTHIPHRDWCRFCIAGRGRVDRHLRLHGEGRLMPVLSFDPFFPGLREDDRPPTAMTFFDSDTKRLGVTMLATKSTEHPYASKWLAAHIELSGHEEAILKSDNEPAVLTMKKQTMELTQGVRLAPKEKPSRDPKSNPDDEAANNIADGLMRCHKAQMDEGIGHKVPSEHPVLAWLALYVGVVYNISHVGSDGFIPYEGDRG